MAKSVKTAVGVQAIGHLRRKWNTLSSCSTTRSISWDGSSADRTRFSKSCRNTLEAARQTNAAAITRKWRRNSGVSRPFCRTACLSRRRRSRPQPTPQRSRSRPRRRSGASSWVSRTSCSSPTPTNLLISWSLMVTTSLQATTRTSSINSEEASPKSSRRVFGLGICQCEMIYSGMFIVGKLVGGGKMLIGELNQ